MMMIWQKMVRQSSSRSSTRHRRTLMHRVEPEHKIVKERKKRMTVIHMDNAYNVLHSDLNCPLISIRVNLVTLLD